MKKTVIILSSLLVVLTFAVSGFSEGKKTRKIASLEQFEGQWIGSVVPNVSAASIRIESFDRSPNIKKYIVIHDLSVDGSDLSVTLGALDSGALYYERRDGRMCILTLIDNNSINQKCLAGWDIYQPSNGVFIRKK